MAVKRALWTKSAYRRPVRDFTVRIDSRDPVQADDAALIDALRRRVGALAGLQRSEDGHVELVVELSDGARADQALDVAEALMAEAAGSQWRAHYRARVV